MYIEQGQSIKLVPTDPWDFVTATGSGPFHGVVTRVDTSDYETIIVRLDDPLRYKGTEASFIAASTRHIGEKFDRGTAFCNMVSLTEEEGRSGVFRPDPHGEGRLQFIGDISWK